MTYYFPYDFRDALVERRSVKNRCALQMASNSSYRNVAASVTLGLTIAAFIWLARELRASDAPDLVELIRTLDLRGPYALVTLTRAQHPRLFAVTQAIGDDETTRRVSYIVTLVDGIERDALVCVAGARRAVDPTATPSVVIRPDTSVFDADGRLEGELYGEHVSAPAVPTTHLRNALLEAALAQRKAVIKAASARLLETDDAVEHVRLHIAYAQLDTILLGLMKRIALSCAMQRTRLGLQYTFKYAGMYGADFVSTAMSL